MAIVLPKSIGEEIQKLSYDDETNDDMPVNYLQKRRSSDCPTIDGAVRQKEAEDEAPPAPPRGRRASVPENLMIGVLKQNK